MHHLWQCNIVNSEVPIKWAVYKVAQHREGLGGDSQ